MAKTIRLNGIGAAQGLRVNTYSQMDLPSTIQRYTGYVSNEYTTGKNFYVDADTYPVSIEFEKLPQELERFTPTSVNVVFCGGVNKTIDKEYWQRRYYFDEQPSINELKQWAREDAEFRYPEIRVIGLAEPIDLKNKVFSCYITSRAEWANISPKNVSVGSVNSRYEDYEYIYTVPTTTQIYDGSVVSVDLIAVNTIINNGIRIGVEYEDFKIYAPSESYPAYIELTYYEGGLVTYINSPSGYTDETGTILFSWHTTYTGFPVENVAQTSAQIQWKDGESGTVHNISVSGGSTEYRMAANTLPESQNILWRVVAQTAEGQSTSEWTTVQTQDSVSAAAAISPAAAYVDGQKEMLFTWDHVTDTGTAQTGYEIQYKTASSDWTTAQQESTANEYAYLPAGSLPSGSVTWRVRTYNAEGIAGAWSNELTIVVIAAPKAPSVSVSVSAPRPVVSWQSREQQAFEVEIGGVKSGTIYGTSKSYQWPDFLGNGTQIARVRVLNEFGIWSPWGSTSFSVSNVPSESVVRIFGTGGTDAELSWNSIPEASEYWVYRNEERIAKVSGTDYADRLYLGTANYFVRAVHSDGYNYTDSNRVTLTLSVDHAMITALDGEWLDIGYSLTSVPNVSVTRSQDVAMMQYNGARLPIPEVSPFEQRTYSISCAFADRQMAARFDELLGRLCCVKDQYGNCMVGMLYSYTRVQNTFTTAYTATLYEVDRSAYEEN